MLLSHLIASNIAFNAPEANDREIMISFEDLSWGWTVLKISKIGVQKSLHGWIYIREVSGVFSLLHQE